MKPRLLITTILASFLFIGIVGCDDKEEKSNEQSIFTGVKDLSHTECKAETKAFLGKEYLNLKAEGKYLAVEHINAVFNCCPGELSVTSKVSNDTIFINETEKEAGCKCICPYDLNYKVGALEYGKYHVILSQMDANTILVEFDLNFNSETTETINIGQK